MLTFSMMLQPNRNIFNMKHRHLFPQEVTEQLVEIPLYGGEIYVLSLLLKLCFCLWGTGTPSVLWLCTPLANALCWMLCLCWSLQPSFLIMNSYRRITDIDCNGGGLFFQRTGVSILKLSPRNLLQEVNTLLLSAPKILRRRQRVWAICPNPLVVISRARTGTAERDQCPAWSWYGRAN